MDLNDIRTAVTLASLALFVALVAHTWSRRRQPEHANAAALPFVGDPLDRGQLPVQGGSSSHPGHAAQQGERRE